jgi:hypothetical protein
MAAIKISATTVINSSRKGIFTSLNPGVYSSPPSGASTGDFIYNSSTQQIQVYNGSTWV